MLAIKSYLCCLFLLRIVSYTSLPYEYHGGWLIRDGNCLRYASTRDHYRLLMVSVLLIVVLFFVLCCLSSFCVLCSQCCHAVSLGCPFLDFPLRFYLTFIYHYDICCSSIVRCFSLCLGDCFLSCIFS